MIGRTFDFKPCLIGRASGFWVDPNVLMHLIKRNVVPHMCLIHVLGLAYEKFTLDLGLRVKINSTILFVEYNKEEKLVQIYRMIERLNTRLRCPEFREGAKNLEDGINFRVHFCFYCRPDPSIPVPGKR